MSEQESMDSLLRDTLGSAPSPHLSPAFDRRLKQRLRRRRLNPAGRWLMSAYLLAAPAVSLAVMRSQALDWSLITIAMLAPLLALAAVPAQQRSPDSRRQNSLGR